MKYLPLTVTIYDSNLAYDKRLEKFDRNFIEHFGSAVVDSVKDIEVIKAGIAHFDRVLFFVALEAYYYPTMIRHATAVTSVFTTAFNKHNASTKNPYTFSVDNQLFPDLIEEEHAIEKVNFLVEYANHWIDVGWKKLQQNKVSAPTLPGFENTLVDSIHDLVKPTIVIKETCMPQLLLDVKGRYPNDTIIMVK